MFYNHLIRQTKSSLRMVMESWVSGCFLTIFCMWKKVQCVKSVELWLKLRLFYRPTGFLLINSYRQTKQIGEKVNGRVKNIQHIAERLKHGAKQKSIHVNIWTIWLNISLFVPFNVFIISNNLFAMNLEANEKIGL